MPALPETTMPDHRSLTPISERDYEAIEAAVMETERGRWFLGAFAQRNRTADTAMLLEAMQRLERAVVGEREAQALERLRADLVEMARSIARTRADVAALQPAPEASPLGAASCALEAIVRQTEHATSEILEAAEQVQETAWTLREEGADEGHCDALDRRATAIYTACSFQDLTAQRMGRITQTLREIEGRIHAMVTLCGGEVEEFTPSPVPPAPDLDQGDIDLVITDADLFESASEAVGEAEACAATARQEWAWEPDPTPPVAEAGIGEPWMIDVEDLLFAEGDGAAGAAFEVPPAPGLALREAERPVAYLPAPALAVPRGALEPAAPVTLLPALDPAAFAEIDAMDPLERLRRFT